MSARMRARAFVWVGLLASWSMPSVRAEPILYSTSGTIDIANEPNPQILGVSGVAAVADSTGQLPLGNVQINPVDGWSSVRPPDVANSPFDIRLDFNSGDLPSLELKGVFHPGWSGPAGDWAYQGTVASIVSSSPSLNGHLPAPFADALSSPDILRLHIGMWDWGVSRLPLTLSVEELKAVPEPSTLVLFGAIVVLGVCHRSATRRRRAS